MDLGLQSVGGLDGGLLRGALVICKSRSMIPGTVAEAVAGACGLEAMERMSKTLFSGEVLRYDLKDSVVGEAGRSMVHDAHTSD